MLSNLQQLQYNLTSLISEFQQIKNKLVSPIEAKRSNQNTLLIKLPKVILLIRVCPYLQYNDIVNLSSASSILRKCIFSPIGWKILNRIFTPYPIIIKEFSIQQRPKMSNSSELDALHYSLPEDEKNLRKSRLDCKKQLMQLYEKYKQKEEQFVQLSKKLQSQKTQIKKLSMQREFFQAKQQMLHEQNQSYKQELKSINIGFNEKIISLDKENEQLIQQNNKLQNQKGALVNKIREYQNEIESIKSESQKSKAILKRIKNYLLYKQL